MAQSDTQLTRSPQHMSAQPIVTAYLARKSPEFQTLTGLREKVDIALQALSVSDQTDDEPQGWANPNGDTFFQAQRQNADDADAKTAKIFYKIMRRIAKEIQKSKGALSITNRASSQCSILDFCTAPGGFLGAALAMNPGSHAVAFSLPTASGGHEILLPKTAAQEIRLLDITMLAADMGVIDIPTDHEDAKNFLPRQLKAQSLHNLVLCDGQVLRTHPRASYRDKREARRLTLTQLALGLEHVIPNGTMIVLLHKVDAWHSVCLLQTFSRFATVRLMKPVKAHATRSSFYMIATDIQALHPEAVRAVAEWKAVWKTATFGTDEEYKAVLERTEADVEQVLKDFGPSLVAMGREIWEIQARALEKMSWTR